MPAFANSDGISMVPQRATYLTVKQLTGEKNPALEDDFGRSMGCAALGFARHKDTREAYSDIDFSTL